MSKQSVWDGIKRKSVLAIMCGMAGACLARAELAPPPEILLPACRTPPTLDGVLNDSCWETAAVIETLNVYRKAETTDAACFKLAFDAQWLYIAAQIKHPMPEHIKPKALKHDGSVNQDDSIEIFVDPGTDGRLYYHYLLNAANVRAEQQKTRNESGSYDTDRKWDVPWRSATRITDEGWQAEIALPLSVLAADGNLDKLRMNLCGTIRIPVIDPQGVEVYQERVSFTWSKLFQQFHEPFRFGFLRGLENAQPETPFLAGLRHSMAGNYTQTDNQYGYEIKSELHVLTPLECDVEIRVTDRPMSAESEHVSECLTVRGPAVREIKIFVPVKSMASRTAELELVDRNTGEILQIEYVTDTEHLTLLSGVFADRSFYTGETVALVRGRVALPAEALQGMTAVVRDAAGKTMGSADAISSDPEVRINLKDVPTGLHRWSLVLLNKEGAAVIRREFDLIKRDAKPGKEWKIDRLKRVLLRGNEPYFPIGVVFCSTNDQDFAAVSAAGMNSVLRWHSFQNPTNAADFHAQAARHGLLVVDRVDRYADLNLVAKKSSPDFPALVEKNMDRMLLGVNNTKDLDTLMAYFHFDEPLWEHQIEPGRKLYHAVNAVDGYHPWMVLYSSHIPPGDEWLDWSNIVGTDPYWIPNGEQPGTGVRGTVNWMSKITTWTKRRGDAVGHPTWIVPVGELWSGMRKRVILPKEQMCQSYLAVIHGAKGLFYFAYPYKHVFSREAMKQLGREFKEIGPIAVTPDIPQSVVYDPGKYDPDTDQYPDVQVALRRRTDGVYVLLAANSRPYPVKARYKIAGLANGDHVSRLFGTEKYPVENGGFSEKLAPYATRAYLLNPGDIPAPAAVNVEMKAFADEADPRYAALAIPDSGRMGKRNLVRNPSFEEATLPDWPDYYIYLYDQHGRTDIGVLGTATGSFAVDTNTAWHGQASFRLKSREGSWRRWLSWWSGFAFTLVPKVEKPVRYVFSAYMKADNDGVVARLCGFDDVRQLDSPEAKDFPEFKLTTEWKRYSHSGLLTPSISRYHLFGVRTLGEGTVWVDALQVEKGMVPTDFEP